MLKKILAALCCLCAFTLAAADELEELLQETDKTPASKPFKPELQRTFTIIDAGYHLDLNPHTSSYTNEAQIINSLQEGLFCYNPKDLEPVPALAETYRLSRDKKRWTFKIRENAKFSDGQPITPQSIIDSWLKLQKTQGAPYASLLDCIKGIKEFRENNCSAEEVGLKANGQNLIVTLTTPTAYLPRLLCHHAFSVFTGNSDIYSGAYTISDYTNEGITLTKNPEYWDKDNVALNNIRIQFSDNKTENTWLFNTGRAEWVVSTFDSDKLLNKNSLRISALFGTTYIFFTCRNPIWNKADFRNALMAAVPWETLRKQYLTPATTLVYPLAGYPQIDGLSETNPDEAVELMAEARKTAGIPEDKKLEITFGIVKNEFYQNLAQNLQEAWEPLGVKVVTYNIEESQYLSNIPYLNYDLFTFSWIGDYADPVAFLELFRKDSTLNQTKWENQIFTDTLNLSDLETDQTQRYKLLAKAEQVLLDDGVVMPVSHSISIHAINLQQTGGWYPNALDIHPFKFIYFKDYEPELAPNIVKK